MGKGGRGRALNGRTGRLLIIYPSEALEAMEGGCENVAMWGEGSGGSLLQQIPLIARLKIGRESKAVPMPLAHQKRSWACQPCNFILFDLWLRVGLYER